MSGIDEIKQKAKLSMDELYEAKPVGKPENQQAGKPTNQSAIHSSNNPTNQRLDSPKKVGSAAMMNKAVRENSKPTRLPTSQPAKKMDHQKDGPPGYLTKNQPTAFASPQSQDFPPDYSRKMTFNLSQKAYKAFNDIYAKRMIQGRKIEKSDLMCEIIEYFVQMNEGSD